MSWWKMFSCLTKRIFFHQLNSRINLKYQLSAIIITLINYLQFIMKQIRKIIFWNISPKTANRAAIFLFGAFMTESTTVTVLI